MVSILIGYFVITSQYYRGIYTYLIFINLCSCVYSVLTDESLLPVLVKRSEEKPNEFISRKIKQQLDFLHDKFSVEINYKTFVDHYKKIVPHIQTIGKTKVVDKNEILNIFSP